MKCEFLYHSLVRSPATTVAPATAVVARAIEASRLPWKKINHPPYLWTAREPIGDVILLSNTKPCSFLRECQSRPHRDQKRLCEQKQGHLGHPHQVETQIALKLM